MKEREESVKRASLSSGDKVKDTTGEISKGFKKLMRMSQQALNLSSVILVWKVWLMVVSGPGTLHKTRCTVMYILIQCIYKNSAKTIYVSIAYRLVNICRYLKKKIVTNSLHEELIAQLEHLSIFSRCHGNIVYIKDPWYRAHLLQMASRIEKPSSCIESDASCPSCNWTYLRKQSIFSRWLPGDRRLSYKAELQKSLCATYWSDYVIYSCHFPFLSLLLTV